MDSGIINNRLQIQKKWPEYYSNSQQSQQISDIQNTDFLSNNHLSSDSVTEIEYSLSAQQNPILVNDFTCHTPLQHIYHAVLSNYFVLQNALLNSPDPFLIKNAENNTNPSFSEPINPHLENIPTLNTSTIEQNPINFYDLFFSQKNKITQCNLSLLLNTSKHKSHEYYENAFFASHRIPSAQQKSSHSITHNEYMRNLHEITTHPIEKLDPKKRIHTELIRIENIKRFIIELYKKEGIPPEINAKIFNNIYALKKFLQHSFKVSKKYDNAARNEEFYKRISSVIWFFIKKWHFNFKKEFINYFKEDALISKKTIETYINGVNKILINMNKKSFILNANISQKYLTLSKSKKIIEIKKIQDQLIHKIFSKNNIELTLNTEILNNNELLEIIILYYIKYFIDNMNNINNDHENNNKWNSKIITHIKNNTKLESSIIKEATFEMFERMKGLLLQDREYGNLFTPIANLV